MAKSKRSDATHEHRDEGRKIDVGKIPGVNIVEKHGRPKISVTKQGRERLKKELE